MDIGYLKEVFEGQRNYPLRLPLAPGCGAVGRVRAVGPDATRLQAGQLVFCDPTVRARDDPVAPDILLQGLIAPGEGPQHLQGYYRHGAFAERMLLLLENAVPLDGLQEVDPPRLCWLNTCLVPYGGLLAAGLLAGETVLVSGATGHFGSAAVAVALAMGAARVVAAGRNRPVLDDLVRRLGPRVCPVPLTGDEAEDRHRLHRGAEAPIDRVLDMLLPLGDASPVRAAALAVRPHGTVVLMGGVDAPLDLPYKEVMRNSLTVRGQFMYPRDAPRRLAALIRGGLLALEQVERAMFGLDDINVAVDHAATTAGPWRLTVITP